MKKFAILLLTVFLISCIASSLTNSKKVIAIQTLNGFPDNLRDTVQKAIEDYYHFETVVYDDIKIPKDYFIAIKSPRYRADSIIRFLRDIKPDSVDHMIGLTKMDISITKFAEDGNIRKPVYRYKDFGIFGLGFRPGESCVVSNFRLKHANQQKYIDRIKKVCLHELGHNLGLPHCKSKKCFMRSAEESIQSIDEEDLAMCASCFNRVQ